MRNIASNFAEYVKDEQTKNNNKIKIQIIMTNMYNYLIIYIYILKYSNLHILKIIS